MVSVWGGGGGGKRKTQWKTLCVVSVWGGSGGRERPNRKRSDFPLNIASHFCVHIDRFRGMCRSICVLFQLFHNYDEYNPRENIIAITKKFEPKKRSNWKKKFDI